VGREWVGGVRTRGVTDGGGLRVMAMGRSTRMTDMCHRAAPESVGSSTVHAVHRPRERDFLSYAASCDGRAYKPHAGQV